MSQGPKFSHAEDTILIYIVSKYQPHIFYILGYMILPSKGSVLFQNSSLNKTPGKNCCSVGYRGSNGIPKDVPRKGTAFNFVGVNIRLRR